MLIRHKKEKSTTNNKSKTKIIISIVSIILIGIMLFGGYKFLQTRYTPENAIKEYCTYLANKDYKKAYEILYNTDNDFLSEEIFEGSLKDIDFSGYSIKEPTNNSTTYEIQADGHNYTAEIKEKGKKFFLFPNYKINADNLTVKDWIFYAPRGTEVYINDKKINNITTSPESPKAAQYIYYPQVDTYSINNIFKGNYNVTFKLNGADDVVKNNVQAGNRVIPDIKISKEFTEQLTNQAKDFFKVYYNEGANYDKFLSSNNDVAAKMPSRISNTDKSHPQYFTFIGDKISIEEVDIGDGSHAKLRIMYTVNAASGTEIDQINTLYFKTENDKWVIYSVEKP